MSFIARKCDVGGRPQPRAALTRRRRWLAVLGVAGLGVVASAAPGSALAITRDAHGALAPVTIVASGFKPGAQVYVEECDGVAPTTPQWSPTINCDIGSSPSPVTADAHGTATFPATDANRGFRPVDGESPSHLFNCVAAGERPRADRLKTFTNCQVRVSTNNSTTTTDQVLLAMTFPPPGARPLAAAAPHATSKPTVSARAHAATTAAPHRAAPPSLAPQAPVPASGAPSVQTSCAPDCPPAATHHGAGLIAFTDSGVALGYGLFTAGIAMVLAAMFFGSRRRSFTPAAPQG